MSRFFSESYKTLVPYTPGEQPRERSYIKLNTNESPFPPSEKAVKAAAKAAASTQLYCDPTAKALREALAPILGVAPENLICTNGSDEILNFSFMAYCDKTHPAAFPDITYGFYEVFAELHGIPYQKLPLREDFTIDPEAYKGIGATIFIANPNAPTGIALKRREIEAILAENPDNVVVIDEAYVDFGAESCVGLIHSYDNLLVTGTFSKSRSMAGARLGFGVASEALIADLSAIRYSTNPYNVNAMTMAAGIGTLADEAYTRQNCQVILENRRYVSEEMKKLGFTLTESMTNFVFAKHELIAGEALYTALRERGILVRHFSSPRIADYNRITIGSKEECEALITALAAILESL